MAKVLNLDELVPNEATVILDGKELILPIDIPLEQMLQLMKLQKVMEKDPSDPEAMESAFKILFDIVALKNEVTWEWFSPLMTLERFSALLLTIFQAGEEDEKKTPEKEEPTTDEAGNSQ